MEQDKDIDLSKLAQDSYNDLVEDRRRSIAGTIKQLFQKAFQLKKDREETNKKLSKIDKSYKDTTDKLEKLQKGDWSVLAEDKKFEEPKEEIKE